MITVRLTVGDATAMRFACSPLAELANSLYILATRQVHAVHRPWLTDIRHRLSATDLSLLAAIVPSRAVMPDFLFCGAVDSDTTIDDQLATVASVPIDYLRGDLRSVWQNSRLPAALESALNDRSAGNIIADALHEYWNLAIMPYWSRIRANLEGDVAYRAQLMSRQSVGAIFDEIHPEVGLQNDFVTIDKPQWRSIESRVDLAGQGLILVPSAFAWPRVGFAHTFDDRPTLIYPIRGIGTLWEGGASKPLDDGDPLAALIGRSRAAILRRLAQPRSTTELASELDYRPSAVSQHLSVLKRSGLATSWRRGKSVMYRRTPLADAMVGSGLSADDAMARHAGSLRRGSTEGVDQVVM